LRRDESDWSYDSCSFKIYSSVSKNFQSAYYLLDELIDQLNIEKFPHLNDLWNNLIKISCAQVFTRRLKLLNLLIKIMHRVEEYNMEQMCINLFALKPLKSLQYTLEMTSKEDRNLSRALFELFFFAEKLTIKWCIQNEYRAQMKDKGDFIEKLCETSCFINMILASINVDNSDHKVEVSDVKKDSVMEKVSITKNEYKQDNLEDKSEDDDDDDDDDYDEEEENDDNESDDEEDDQTENELYEDD
jgi:hypothetical protein